MFFTNYNSRKGRELTSNPHAALCFYWASLDEQIRIEGRVERVTADESDEYFVGRPRGSQLGAWASEQSQVLSSRETLEEKYREIERRFEGQAVQRPPFWGGFRLIPSRIEFWYGRPGSPPRSRPLHARREQLAHRTPLSVGRAAGVRSLFSNGRPNPLQNRHYRIVIRLATHWKIEI